MQLFNAAVLLFSALSGAQAQIVNLKEGRPVERRLGRDEAKRVERRLGRGVVDGVVNVLGGRPEERRLDGRKVERKLEDSVGEPSADNLAFEKPTSSSGFFGGYEDFKGVDNDLSTTYHSSSTLNQWWEVDLETNIIITQVKVYNRQDCCQDRLKDGTVTITDGLGHDVFTTTITEEAPLLLTYDFPEGIEGRYVKVAHPTTYLNFANVEVHGEAVSAGLENLVTGKPLTSSPFIPSFEPEKAVDNIEGTIFHSSGPTNAYWEVDFETVAFVREITIINRKDCCKGRMDGAVVAILDNDGNVVESHDVSADAQTEIITLGFPDKPEGRFVKVSHMSEYLHFAEIMVYGGASDDGLENIAINVRATASSVVEGYDAANAVDGLADTLFHVGEEQGGWFEIDFGTVVYMKRITIFNRQNCCQDRLDGAVLTILDVNRAVVKSITIENAGSVVNLRLKQVYEGRFVRIENPGDILHFADLEVYGEMAMIELVNLALHKPVEISDSIPGHEASAIVDGNTDISTHTRHDNNEWVMVDLEHISFIRSIKIFNRQDCCLDRIHDATVSVYDESRAVVWSTTVDAEAPEVMEWHLPDVRGQYVGIVDHDNFLHVSELEVYGTQSVTGLENLALNKSTQQSSTKDDHYSILAVDGETDTFFETDSADGEDSYWMVDLGAEGIIRQIRIQDKIVGAQLSILDNDGTTELESRTITDEAPSIVAFNFEDIEGRYVKISTSNGGLKLKEVEIFGEMKLDVLPNLALYKEATQSSTWDGYGADLAVDGNLETSTHSMDESGNWWSVDLAEVTNIRKIKVFNRADCCKERLQGAVVLILDENGNQVESNTIAFTDNPLDLSVGVTFEYSDVAGRYVNITQDNGWLSLGEVQVFGSLPQSNS